MWIKFQGTIYKYIQNPTPMKQEATESNEYYEN